jgi:hypothetical protein
MNLNVTRNSFLFAIIVLAFGITMISSHLFAKSPADTTALPVAQIQSIMEVQGEVENGVLDLEIERKDIDNAQGPQNTDVTFTPSFQINGDVFFQPLAGGQAFMNGDLALKENEVNPFIDALIANDIVFQAFHQHFPTHPQIWFVHLRATGDPLKIARGVHAAIKTTSTPLPQKPPTNPTTSLDTTRLAAILKSSSISVGDQGVVTAWVLRTDSITIDSVHVNPQTNIGTNIQFRPSSSSDSLADVAPDFAMISSEVDTVANLMRNQLHWTQGCLYSQETAENPQLYFAHMIKSGNAYELAQEIRRALDLTKSNGSPSDTTQSGTSGAAF